MALETITRAVFKGIVANHGSKIFRQQFAHYDLAPFESDCAVHRGHLSASDFLRVPTFNTIIAGDLTVDGLVDALRILARRRFNAAV